jgi:Cysteine-rich secretory protein family
MDNNNQPTNNPTRPTHSLFLTTIPAPPLSFQQAMATTKSQSLFRRVFPARRSRNGDNAKSTFETIGGVYQEPTRSAFTKHQEVMMIIHEGQEDHDDHTRDLGKKLMSLNDSATAATESLSSDGSFDDSVGGGQSSSSASSNNSCSSPAPDILNMDWRRQPSQRNLFANMDMHSLDEEEKEEDVPQCDSIENSSNDCSSTWKSSGDSHHHDGAPLITLRSESVRLIDPRRPELQLGDDEVLHKVLTKASKRLPRHSGNFASLHVMINSERLRHQVAPLQRLPALDEMARQHAAHMGQHQRLQHAELSDLQESLLTSHQAAPLCRIGSNVAACGDGDLLRLFSYMMKDSMADRNNILDRRYTCMGVGTFKSNQDGKLYVCQLFV